MPAGLDGNPQPLVTEQRSHVLAAVGDGIRARTASGTPTLVAIDGIDGSGKSTFGDELAQVLRAGGLAVVRASIDSFHNSQAVRWERGATSPVGFYLDSHNLDALRTRLLEPFAQARGSYVTEIFDVERDQRAAAVPERVGANDVLIFDGIFVHRPELADYWDFSVYLDGQERVDLKRLGYVIEELPADPIDVVHHVLRWNQRIDRYAAGMRYYLDLVGPADLADVVIDNNDLAHPQVVRTAEVELVIDG